MSDGELKVNGAYVLRQPRILPEFELISGNGQAFTKESLKGQWSLIFFGYTQCPDICPTTLATLRQWKDYMEGSDYLDDTQVILVTADPGRDTPEVMKPYVEYFDPSFKAVTGEFRALHRFATSLNSTFAKVPGGGENYLVDHTANVMLINEYGDYHGFFKAPIDAAKLKVTYQSIRGSFNH